MQNRTRSIPEIHFTDSAYSVFYDAVDDPAFRDRDADIIYQALRKKLRAVPFCDYLKRAVHRAAGMTEPFSRVPAETYRRVMAESFRETMTPVSLTDPDAKPATLMKNWLTQKSVRREVVLLLGFGLKMTEEEVNEMLFKALREPALDPDDPEELMAWFCYRNGLVFPRFRRLKELYESRADDRGLPPDLTEEERALLSYLFREKGGRALARAEALRRTFDELYRAAQTTAAALLTAAGKPTDSTAVTGADLENILCAAVPRDGYGNLSPAKRSLLNDLFRSRRPSRQRFHRLCDGKEKPDRFDLITLAFFSASQIPGDRRTRYAAFLDETNALLQSCGMGPVYVANPYECFILMCLLSEDPLGTYCDVWELSYQSE